MTDKIRVTVDVDEDFADSITVQNLKEFYEAMLNDTDDESVELRTHVKYTLKSFMTYDHFELYMNELWERQEKKHYLKKDIFRELDNDD